jgi:glucan phosphoethanolaminetransferase (alkaline phosphatase superfamily)
MSIRKFKILFFYLIWGIFFTLAFNSHLIIRQLPPLQENHSLFYTLLLYETIINIGLALITLYAFSFHKKLLLIFSTSLAFLGAVLSYFIKHYNITIDHNLLASVFDTDKREAFEFIDIYLIAWCGAVSITSYIIVSNIPIRPSKYSFLYSLLALLIFVSLSLFHGSKVNRKYFPFNFIKTSYHYIALTVFDPVQKAMATLAEYSFTPPLLKENLYVVMIIGETARADHFSLNGYHRLTNPKLSTVPNLANFSQFYSFTNTTRFAIPRMLSSITENKVTPRFNIIDIFNSLNFQTAWFGAQGNKSFSRSFFQSARSAKYRLFLGDIPSDHTHTDLDLIAYIEDYIKTSPGNHFIIIHTLGSHWDYDMKTEARFKQFHPLCSMQSRNTSMTGCSQEALINSYDNTILQTDYFIFKVLKIFQDKNAFVLYSSDHGESLGENGIYSHGLTPAPEQFHVAALAWASDKFTHYNKSKFQQLKSYKDTKLNHDFLFHSLLDCAGIESNILDKKYSLCSPINQKP